MEEGELSDDGMDESVAAPVGRTPIKMDLPDLLKELTGAEDFNKIDKDTMNKIAARAERFNTGKGVSFEEISRLYRSMQVSYGFVLFSVFYVFYLLKFVGDHVRER